MKKKKTPDVNRGVLLILFFLQFVFILDHMLLNPLGPSILKAFSISQSDFAKLISSYAVGAILGNSVALFYLDRFDYRRSLLFVLCGFFVGTLICALSPNYHTMLIGRFISGLFGGVLSAISLAIVAALIPFEKRGAAMGFIASGFGLAPVVGVPLGLLIAHILSWEAAFFYLCFFVVVLIGFTWCFLPSVRAPKSKATQTLLGRFQQTVWNKNHWFCFLTGFFSILSVAILVPYIAIFYVNNLGMDDQTLALFYFVGGALSFFVSRFVGKLIDQIGLRPVLTGVQVISIFAIFGTTQLENLGDVHPAVWIVIGSSFLGIGSGRMTAIQSLANLSALPEVRGSMLSLHQIFLLLAFAIGPIVSHLTIYDRPNQAVGGFPESGYLCMGVILTALLIGLLVKTEKEMESPPNRK